MKNVLLISIIIIILTSCIDKQETVTSSDIQTNVSTPVQIPTPTENIPVFPGTYYEEMIEYPTDIPIDDLGTFSLSMPVDIDNLEDKRFFEWVINSNKNISSTIIKINDYLKVSNFNNTEIYTEYLKKIVYYYSKEIDSFNVSEKYKPSLEAYKRTMTSAKWIGEKCGSYAWDRLYAVQVFGRPSIDQEQILEHCKQYNVEWRTNFANFKFMTGGHFLLVRKLGNEPERFIEITAEEFENFPLLKEAINKCASDRDNKCSLDGEYLRASENHTFPILNFMLEKQEKKYSRQIIVSRMPCQTFCVNKTEFDLEEFPTIKKAVGELDRVVEIPPNEWQVFRDLMESRLKKKLGEKYPFTTFSIVYIEVENEYYAVMPYGLYADLNLKVRSEYYSVTNIWLDP